MALTTPIPMIQESRAYLGPGIQQETFLIIPGANDYVTNGYVVKATDLRLSKIQTAWVSGMNATAAGYEALPVFAIAEIGGAGGAGFGGYPQLLFYVAVITTGVQVANGANLSGCIWNLTVQGY